MSFKDRKTEMQALQERLNSDRFELIVIYGRRRVGKTELVLQATRAMKRVYYLATGASNLPRFHDSCMAQVPSTAKVKMDYEVLFDHLKDKVDVIIIDEFQEIIKEDENVVSLLQSVIDQHLHASRLKIVLLGSSISLMQSKVLGYKAPLYGRRTGSMKLEPVRFYDLASFFPGATFEELVEIYGFADGIPQYLVQVKRPFWQWLMSQLKDEIGFLRDELEFLLRYEFSNPSTYKSVLEAIALGNTTVGEIKDRMKVARTDISPYLENLATLGFISRQVPVTENTTTRSGRYYIKDNFIKFWFRFVYPNLSAIESRAFDMSTITDHYGQYLGAVFEEVSMQYVIESKLFPFSKIGHWWWKDHEVDIVGLHEPSETLSCGECKWSEGVDGASVARRLKETSTYIPWRASSRHDAYYIFAKSFSRRIDEIDGDPVRCIDAAEMEKVHVKQVKTSLRHPRQ
nr:ATP-binding protein [Candidatus Sigynarchaeota archaeon]